VLHRGAHAVSILGRGDDDDVNRRVILPAAALCAWPITSKPSTLPT
jgi:hypothetical protein